MYAYVGLFQNLKDLWAFSRLAGPGVCKRVPLRDNSHPFEDHPLSGSAAILCTGGADVIRKEAWPSHRTSSGVRPCWELEESKGPKGPTKKHQVSAYAGSSKNLKDLRLKPKGPIQDLKECVAYLAIENRSLEYELVRGATM